MNIFNNLLNLIKDKINNKTRIKIPNNARIITMWKHNGWGNSIQWQDVENRTVYGHLKTIPKKGDILRVKMQSGMIMLCKFTKVDECNDPSDMFFATVKDLGYETPEIYKYYEAKV